MDALVGPVVGGTNVINRIRTANSFSFQYGRMEVVAKLPIGNWIWPAIWLLPEVEAYGLWPASGEIDVMESRGNNASYSPGGNNCFSSTLHFGPFYSADAYNLTHALYCTNITNGSTSWLTEDFHTYGLVWQADGLYTYIDNDANRTLEVNFTQESFWSEAAG